MNYCPDCGTRVLTEVFCHKCSAKEYIRPTPQHVCGLQGYNGMIDPPCPGCEARTNPSTERMEAYVKHVGLKPVTKEIK